MNRIKEVLKEQGRTQRWLAVQLKCTYVVANNYCNNITQPNSSILRKAAHLLDVDPRDLSNKTKRSSTIH